MYIYVNADYYQNLIISSLCQISPSMKISPKICWQISVCTYLQTKDQPNADKNKPPANEVTNMPGHIQCRVCIISSRHGRVWAPSPEMCHSNVSFLRVSEGVGRGVGAGWLSVNLSTQSPVMKDLG